MSLCNKDKFKNSYIFKIWRCILSIFQTYIIWSNTVNSLKYQRSTTLDCKDLYGITKSEFVAKAQFFFTYSNFSESKWHCFEKRLFYSLDLHNIFFYTSGILQRNECLSEMLLFIRKCKNLLHYLNHFVKFKNIEPIPPPTSTST